MKKLIYIIILVASTSIYAQNAIETDELFLKYEQEYLKIDNSVINNYERAIKNFYSNFDNYKQKNKFEQSKDKKLWLSKNVSKTKFNSVNDALEAYNNLISSREVIDKINNTIEEIRNELLKKYDETVIWETLQTMLKAKMKNKKEEL